jgi:Holliday junction resolvase-like predicted endonuclease
MWKKGQVYEAAVAHRLQQKGWTIVARNPRYKGCELDLIARRDSRLICVEVKARRTIPDPSALLSPRKRQSLARGLRTWLSREGSNNTARQTIEVWLCCIAIEKDPRWLWFDITGLIDSGQDGC